MCLSSLMQAMISNPSYETGDNVEGLKLDDIIQLGDVCFAQLAELRHRGAFSTVAQTFVACCTRCRSSKDYDIENLPKVWYTVRKFWSIIFNSNIE